MNSICYFEIPIRFKDLDALGHVNNAVYITYFEEGRKNFFQKYVNESTRSYEFPFILARIECDYKLSITLKDTIGLKMWVGAIGNRSFDFCYEIVDHKTKSIIYATGKSVQVSFDYRLMKTTPITEELKEKLMPFLKT